MIADTVSDHRWEGLTVGGLAMGAVGGALGIGLCSYAYPADGCALPVIALAASGALVGGVIGGLIGAAIPKE